MATLYTRISDPVHAWITAQAVRSGLSMAAVTEAVMREAMRRGWMVSGGPGAAVREVRAPAPHDGPASGAADQPTPPAGRGPGRGGAR